MSACVTDQLSSDCAGVMNPTIRKAFPFFALAIGVAALAYALSFGTLPEADFAFQNGDQIQTLDPHKATGVPEHRILVALFEGLTREMPASDTPGPDGLVEMHPAPGVASHYDVSEDGETYTFHLRENALWSDGSPVTAHDFVWSWKRVLHPYTAARYAYQLHYIVGAQAFNEATIKEGDRVEVELKDRPNPGQQYPSGTILRGIAVRIEQPPKPTIPEEASEDERNEILAEWKAKWTFLVDVKGTGDGEIDWEAPGETRAFTSKGGKKTTEHEGKSYEIESSEVTLPDFTSTVGVAALNDRTLEVQLNNSTPFFPSLTAFYTLYPVNRKCIETHGSPRWTKEENIVSNGPYTVEMRRIRDRVRMIKNPTYWNADKVTLNRIDAMAVTSNTTALNMFLDGQIDWATDVPRTIIPELMQREDFVSGPQLSVYFYRLNVLKKPLDDVRIRQALNLAINKQQIVDHVSRAGEIPARSVVPPGLSGYTPAYCGEYNVAKAKQLLAEAGFPDGKGMPKVQVLYNTSDNHRNIAEVIERDWRQLGVEVELRNLEWGNYLDAQHNGNYTVARAGWNADYADPNTFLDMWLTGGGQNETNWSNEEYDRLIKEAGAEVDLVKRMELLHSAERILMDELPIIPIYYYVSVNLVNPRVKHFHANVLDQHPLHILEIESK